MAFLKSLSRAWRLRALRYLLALCALGLGAASLAQAREVRVGVYQNEPKIFMGADGQPGGILGDLLVAMARLEGWTLTSVPCEWPACLDALQAGNIDLMPDIASTEERLKLFDLHQIPSLFSWSQLYKHSSVPISSMLDLKGRRVAVLAGSVQQSYLQNLLSSFGVRAELVPFQSLEEAFEKTASQQVDAVATNRFFGDRRAATYQLDATPIFFNPAQLFYATAKGSNADLLAAIDKHLGQWQSQSDSEYFKVLKRWMEVPPRFVVPTYLWWSLGALALLLALALAGGALLRRQVAEKIRHLRASEDRLATILNSVDAFIYIKDAALRYQYANRKVCELFARPLAEVQGCTDSDFFDATTAQRLRANDLRVIDNGERLEAEETNRSLDGTREQTYLSIKLPLRQPDGRIYALCGISADISERKRSEEAIYQLAFYDPLTLLPNRRFLMERLQQILKATGREHHCGALLFIDVDNFKDLNDTLGHAIGDELLRQMAVRLGACTRAGDTLARQGSDEFVLLLCDLSPELDAALEQAQHVAQKILQQIAEPYLLENQNYQSTASIGIAMFGDAPTSRDELFKQADLAMYRAKAEGRNTLCFFNPAMQAQVSARTALEADLHQALTRAEFVLYYQPQVDAAGQQFGVEALVRWQHPQRGLVPPLEFIAVAESTGLILPLGRWILMTACRQLATWATNPAQSQWCIAVNVSARQFRQSDFVQTVQQALLQAGANPQRLELELTESLLVDDVEGVIARMSALKALGVRFSLDDFGTGYSSLSMLKRLPLDQLKIDQSFVHDFLGNAQDANIVKSIVTLGASLNLQVIAEGVETVAQRDALLELGCTHFQGYFFGRPAPVTV
ncbi:MAG: EAL domain-containing protein [Gammaproteobacteria bacterium]|nr:EAL domain-containing protein [Gammaproteobacteria bacterium]MBU3996472.1 EAL domain-containing protein [Gammaproteobacteria bacterium]MBU4080012.1 EAL domain-containing protein [Gammaproteobacteria bacterium]MBU4113468.1 EAL domain-containing protein [Gammaproteobacteria bacterium]MBU4172090.1 EAL domain-containing protein [Gammaproteobacteria bacterium]